MKQKWKALRFIAICLAALMLLGGASGASAVKEDSSIDELIAAQERAVAANEVLMQYFFDNGWITEYPGYFGGCYIEENIFHVRLVSPTNQTMATLSEVLAGYEDVLAYENCQNSQADLQNYTDETTAELIDLGYRVTHSYVDGMTGNVVIGVVEDDVDAVNTLMESRQTYAFGSLLPNVIIEAGSYSETATEDVVGGSCLSTNVSFSAGACGYYNGNNALVTCGHDQEVGTAIKLNGTTIGTVEKVQYSNLGTGDYSIIKLNENADMTHIIGNTEDGLTTITGGTYLSPAVGTYITKYGYKSGYSYGTVTATNVTVWPSFLFCVRGMTQASITSGEGSLAGDSGGPYLVGNAFCGAHHGHEGDNGLSVYFTPYSVIAGASFNAIGKHNCTSWTDAGTTNHSGYCTICQGTVYEAHADYWNDALGKCNRCGRTGASVLD